MDDDFAFRQGIAKELRRDDIDVVEFSTSARFVDMIDDQNPDIVFLNLNSAAPHECVRALLALKECDYSGAVQLLWPLRTENTRELLCRRRGLLADNAAADSEAD